MRGVSIGDGPSSKVNATARSSSGCAGSARNRTDTKSCERAPRTMTSTPGIRESRNCGSASMPRGIGTSWRSRGSRRSWPRRTETRSPLRKRLRPGAGCPLISSAPGKPSRRKTFPLHIAQASGARAQAVPGGGLRKRCTDRHVLLFARESDGNAGTLAAAGERKRPTTAAATAAQRRTGRREDDSLSRNSAQCPSHHFALDHIVYVAAAAEGPSCSIRGVRGKAAIAH